MKNLFFFIAFSLFLFQCGRVGSSNPILLSKPPLYYPAEAQSKGYQGKVVLNLMIHNTGIIDSVGVVKSSGFTILDESAVDYCKNLKFMPLNRKDNDHVEYLWTMNYQLDDENLYSVKYVNNIFLLRKKMNENRLDSKRIENLVKITAYCHDTYGKRINTVKEYNAALKLMVDSEIFHEWEEYWEEFPLHFLAYHDMMKRYDTNKELLLELFDKYVVYDVEYLVYSQDALLIAPDRKDDILKKMYAFLNHHYPEHIPLILQKKYSSITYLSQN